MYCTNCGSPMNDNQEVCLNCGVAKNQGKSFCANCGNPLPENAAVCVNCGVAVNHKDTNYLNGKDKTTMIIICLFLGGFGIHNFMLGETKKGVLKIVASLCFGLGGILALVDLIKIATDSYVVDPNKLI